MKTIKEIYGDYMTPLMCKKVLEVSDEAIGILTMRRNELVSYDLHDDKIGDVVEALDFWEEIHRQYKEYLDAKT